jgi:hypothetical protein
VIEGDHAPRAFPYLGTLLGGYFHQDCYDFGDTDEDIMRDFRKSSLEYHRLGVRADIQRLLHQHGDHLLSAIQAAFSPAIIVGRTDDKARQWLLKIEGLLDPQPADSA